jgi:hypothetical protein
LVVTPPVVTPAPTLSVTLGCTPGTPPALTGCNVAATWGGTPLNSNDIKDVTWDWGDGTNVTTAGPLGSYAYLQAGTYLVAINANVTSPGGKLDAMTSLSLIVP